MNIVMDLNEKAALLAGRVNAEFSRIEAEMGGGNYWLRFKVEAMGRAAMKAGLSGRCDDLATKVRYLEELLDYLGGK